MTLERDIVREIRLALGKRDDCVFWRNAAGFAEHDGRKTRFGLAVGAADLIGMVMMPIALDPIAGAHLPRQAPVAGERLGSHLVARFAALEVKTDTGRLSENQKLFLALVRKMGGFAACVRSVHEAVAAVERCKNGENE